MRRKLTANRFLEVGVVTGSHGLKGALTIFSHTRPAIGVAGYSFWWVGESPESAISYKVNRCWQHGGKKILAELETVHDSSSAEALKQQHIWVDVGEVEVGDDEYLWCALTGFKVLTTDGELLGVVAGLAEFGAQDNLCVATTDDTTYAGGTSGEWLLPFVEDVIVLIDEAEEIIEVNLPDGIDICFTPRS